MKICTFPVVWQILESSSSWHFLLCRYFQIFPASPGHWLWWIDYLVPHHVKFSSGFRWLWDPVMSITLTPLAHQWLGFLLWSNWFFFCKHRKKVWKDTVLQSQLPFLCWYFKLTRVLRWTCWDIFLPISSPLDYSLELHGCILLPSGPLLQGSLLIPLGLDRYQGISQCLGPCFPKHIQLLLKWGIFFFPFQRCSPNTVLINEVSIEAESEK